MAHCLLLLVSLLLVTLCWSFPVGLNLSPLGGNIYNSVADWDSNSTYVFINIFKHCSALYVRSVRELIIAYILNFKFYKYSL